METHAHQRVERNINLVTHGSGGPKGSLWGPGKILFSYLIRRAAGPRPLVEIPGEKNKSFLIFPGCGRPAAFFPTGSRGKICFLALFSASLGPAPFRTTHRDCPDPRRLPSTLRRLQVALGPPGRPRFVSLSPYPAPSTLTPPVTLPSLVRVLTA